MNIHIIHTDDSDSAITRPTASSDLCALLKAGQAGDPKWTDRGAKGVRLARQIEDRRYRMCGSAVRYCDE